MTPAITSDHYSSFAVPPSSSSFPFLPSCSSSSSLSRFQPPPPSSPSVSFSLPQAFMAPSSSVSFTPVSFSTFLFRPLSSPPLTPHPLLFSFSFYSVAFLFWLRACSRFFFVFSNVLIFLLFACLSFSSTSHLSFSSSFFSSSSSFLLPCSELSLISHPPSLAMGASSQG